MLYIRKEGIPKKIH